MKKHAYLIMAHSDWSLLSKLLKVLDDPRNDIYIHIDKKSSFSTTNVYSPIFSKCIYIKRMNVAWGGHSQIKCELALLEAASRNHYEYYHLISGQDLPIKNQNAIHEFFCVNSGKNYIKIDPNAMASGYALARIRDYHFFQNLIGKKEGHIIGLLRRLDSFCLSLQRLLSIDRLKNCSKKIYKGTNWFSITDAMVQTVLSEKKFIKKYCYWSLCADEIFLQTVAMNSDLKSTLVDDDLRCIDWQRGNPYTYLLNDYDSLVSNSKLFARKFSDNLDQSITTKIVQYVTCTD